MNGRGFDLTVAVGFLTATFVFYIIAAYTSGRSRVEIVEF